MAMLVLSGDEVEALLDLDRLVDALAAAHAELSAGRASMPRRAAAEVPTHDGLLAVMPAFLGSVGALTTKAVSLFPHNTEVPTHQAVICCFDPADGSPVALMDGEHITAARTAAASALSARLLSRPGAAVVAVVGTGVQAASHARAMARLPGIEMVWLAGRDPSKVKALTETLAPDLGDLGVEVESVVSIEDAVRSAGVVCLTTHADRPVIARDWLMPGTHVTTVGYNSAGVGEVDVDTVRDAQIVVEHRDSALAPPPAGAVVLHHAIAEGAITADDVVAELGEVVAGTVPVPGRLDVEQLTLYASVGVAVQDAGAAALVLAAAQDQGVGVKVDF
jgi:ornithine cyclodeaminase